LKYTPVFYSGFYKQDVMYWNKLKSQPNLSFLLNTSADGVELDENGKISTITAAQISTEKRYRITGTIFIDASSTTYFLIPHLRNIPELTVITNNPNVNIALANQNIRSFCTGGEMLNGSVALVGSEAERFVRGIHAHAVFFSARGVCDGAISDSSAGERNVKIAMLEHATRKYFLCDTSKYGQLYPYLITQIDEIDAVLDET